MSDDHPALDNYDVDTDYCDVDNSPDTCQNVVSNALQNPEINNDLTRYLSSSSNRQFTAKRDDMKDSMNDGRSLTRTTFHGHTDQYERLAKINDGMYHSSRRTQNRKAETRRWIQTLCTRLEVGDTVASRVTRIITSINMKHLGMYSKPEAILATIELVEGETRMARGGRPLHNEPMFHTLVGDIDSDIETLRRVRRLIREKSDLL